MRNRFTYTRVRSSDAVLFLQQLSFLLSSDIPLLEGLRITLLQSKGEFKQIITALVLDISEGRTLGQSIGAFPRIWNPYVAQAIAASEQGGNLAESLARIADQLHRKSALQKKVLGALMYPCIIAVSAISLTITLVGYIFPKILPVLSSLGGTLPLPTRIVLAISTYISTWGIVTGIILTLLICALIFAVHHSISFRRQVDILVLRMPLFGALIRDYHVSAIHTTMSSLLSNGMLLPQALACTALSESRISYREALENIQRQIERGGRISTELQKYPYLFQNIAVQLITTGEASGSLAKACVAVADFHTREATERMQALSALIEPVLMIFLGLIVGLVAVSIIEPIYAISGHLHAH